MYLVVYASEIIPLGNITGSHDERWAWLSVLVTGAFIGCFDGLLQVLIFMEEELTTWFGSAFQCFTVSTKKDCV